MDMRKEETCGSICSKTSVSINENGCEISETNEDEESKQNNNGGISSSNSTIEENSEKKPSVRPYVRSKFPRLRWTPDLHFRFLHAVQRLGGQERATPKLVLQLMNIKGLSIAHVKSHLQMYRSKKVVDTNKVLGDHRLLVDNGDKNVYNLTQLPMLQGYTPNQTSSNRCGYGDDSIAMYENMVHMSSVNESRADFYGRMIERTNNNNINNMQVHNIFQVNSSNFRELSTSKVHEPNDNFLSFCGNESFRLSKKDDLQVQPREQELMPNDNQVDLKTLKRKASNMDLDLDLSLKLNSRIIGDDHKNQGIIEDHHEVGSNLSLSLYSQSSYNLCKRKKEGQDDSKEQEKRVNIGLDLTI
ncbi:putative transcription factor KAN2-like protein [Trifolium pratense]|uniref:Putative transcription factor KAN2-like protein n=1 Tax=Trifolium pratense TaxID=57577 RepID=A0A2K3NCZ6_TRIPR|nr:putative transcription factor KAN2-like protein [Trifolium pratense]